MADEGKSLADIGRRIEAIRTMLGMNQTAFAKFVGTTQSAISQYEGGIRRPLLDVAMTIRLKTGVTLDWIYEGDRGGLPVHLASKLTDLSVSDTRQAG